MDSNSPPMRTVAISGTALSGVGDGDGEDGGEGV